MRSWCHRSQNCSQWLGTAVNRKSRPSGRLLAPTGSEILSGFPQGRGILDEPAISELAASHEPAASGYGEVLLRFVCSLHKNEVGIEADNHERLSAKIAFPNLPSGDVHLNLPAIGTLTTAAYHGGQA